MLRQLMALILLAIFSAACTLSTVPPLVEPPPILTQEIGQTITSTPTPTTTPSPTPSPTITRTPVVLPNCQPRTDWPIYIVAGGDTLASIAQRINSSINELTQGNCLSNPNLITPGQQLRVPRLPPLPNPDTQAGAIQVSPFVMAEGGSYTVQANTPITVSWPQARRDLTRVEFYAAPFTNNPPTTLLGVDPFPSDGAAIPVTFPLGFQQAVFAIGYLSNGSRQLTASRIPVFAVDTGPQVQGSIVIAPLLDVVNGVQVVEADRLVTLTWQNAPTHLSSQYEFALYQGNSITSLGIDNNSADGVSITWRPSFGIENARIIASTRLPHQTGQSIQSQEALIRVGATTGPTQQGTLVVVPTLRDDSGWQVVQAGSTVTITWSGVPTSNVLRVEFYLAPTGTGMPLQLLATDDNPADGASVTWTVPGQLSAHLSATAFTINGREIRPSNDLLGVVAE